MQSCQTGQHGGDVEAALGRHRDQLRDVAVADRGPGAASERRARSREIVDGGVEQRGQPVAQLVAALQAVDQLLTAVARIGYGSPDRRLEPVVIDQPGRPPPQGTGVGGRRVVDGALPGGRAAGWGQRSAPSPHHNERDGGEPASRPPPAAGAATPPRPNDDDQDGEDAPPTAIPAEARACAGRSSSISATAITSPAGSHRVQRCCAAANRVSSAITTIRARSEPAHIGAER